MRCFRGKTSCNPSTCFPKIRMRCSWRLNPQIIRSLVKNVHLTLVQSTLLGFFCCASRQWRRGNMHLIATPPVLDCLSPLGATSAAERSLEKSLLLSRKTRAASLLASRMIPVQSLPSQPHPNCCSPSLMGGKKQPQQTKLQAHGETDKQRLRSSPYRQETTKCEHPFSGKGRPRLAPPSGRLRSCCSMQTLGSSSEFPKCPTVLGTHCLDAAHTAQIVEINTFKRPKAPWPSRCLKISCFSPLCAAPCNCCTWSSIPLLRRPWKVAWQMACHEWWLPAFFVSPHAFCVNEGAPCACFFCSQCQLFRCFPNHRFKKLCRELRLHQTSTPRSSLNHLFLSPHGCLP